MTSQDNEFGADEYEPDDPATTGTASPAADPTSYAPQEPASEDTGTVYEEATGEPAVTPADESATEDDDEDLS